MSHSIIKNDSELRVALDRLLFELEKEGPKHIENVAQSLASYMQGYVAGLVRMDQKVLDSRESWRQDLIDSLPDAEPEKGSPELDPIDQFDKMWVPNKDSKIAHLVQREVADKEFRDTDYPHAAHSLCGYKLVKPRYSVAMPLHKNQPVISVEKPHGWYICKNCEKVANAI